MKKVNNLINLLQESFPILITKEINSLEGLINLGQLKRKIKIDLSINKVSSNLFLVRGSINATFITECQKCRKPSDVELNIASEVGLKNSPEEESDSKISYEIHYQNLELFDIDKLISEEIYLNYPSIVLCCSSEITIEESLRNIKKIQPFKKIKDLIK
tara:strand:- start:327 stop:803 length:477 start_codon:yes stop_codon:yes gene_type:complete